jgi:UPF0755 protein
MIDRFMAVAGEIKFTDSVQGVKVTPFEALVLASITQKEAYHEEDMGKIARVFYNRLSGKTDAGTILKSEVTINYWLLANGRQPVSSVDQKASDTQDASNPYNTYVHPGIPPGPISSPGKAALQAVINPTPGNWAYFIATDKDGTTEFAANNAGFQVLLTKARRNGTA